ncbi:ABC-2 type transport system permease protein [Desulfatibacillum alkenivorans DSM 16219]|jgi:ABC-2 type transport system permease protein|uniref:ABC-2 type transport system permease protein n=1 Tax=Desulfatibacillum alkenivorans DSM 16219 TaxID=1121393 RepID=A0A1M6GJ55_9BACT|nr:hypothetical protein [Desulfatibacillum alkenivorans]SHJ09987.1 ABC-2 type transport system permease protein [Desulfatibacillum alkenivorans DSM 16219]
MFKTATLIRPRIIGLKRYNDFEDGKSSQYRALLFALFGLAFWIGIFWIFFEVLTYFQGVEEFGDILAEKLLSMVFLTFFALLLFSSVIASLSKLYLSRDLHLVFSYPVDHRQIFLARWMEAAFDSSWMVLVYATPAFFSYGIVYQQGALFYLNMLLVLIPFCVSASIISTLAVMAVVVALPANRLRGMLIFVGMGLFVGLYFLVRMLRPERLVDPDAAFSVSEYIASLRTPAADWLPSTWAFDSMTSVIHGNYGEALFHNATAYSAAGGLVFIAFLFSGLVYFRGVTKAQITRTGKQIEPERRHYQGRRLFGFIKGPKRAIMAKEIKIFMRDSTQWSQIFLVAALVAIYLYNFKVLPLEKAPIKTVYLQNLFSFLNMALAAFVLTSIAARFAFPAVSQEKSAFWILQSGPVSLKTVLWIKFAVYVVPLTIMSQILIIATNILLQVTPFMMWMSSLTLLFMAPGIVSLAVGLGAAYPDFQSENPAQTVTSYGGLLFMILSALFTGLVVILESGPVYSVVYAGLRGKAVSDAAWTWTAISFGLVLVLCAVTIVLPMRYGGKKLAAR